MGPVEALLILGLVALLALAAGAFSLHLFNPNFLNLEYFFNLIYQWLAGSWRLQGNPALLEWLARLWWLALLVSLVLAIFIIYLLNRIWRIRQEEKFELESVFEEALEAKSYRNKRWDNLLTHLESDNPSEWKLAIIEADTLLDEMVSKMGYPGENLGERLKAVEPSDFTTLQAAWEAHKVRNQIAHESGFQLSKREARRVIGLFEQVFREFHFI